MPRHRDAREGFPAPAGGGMPGEGFLARLWVEWAAWASRRTASLFRPGKNAAGIGHQPAALS
ncbi:MAG TPA: hypothetical protein VGK19_09065 [Capsulimonadaceae bacterium]